MHYNVATALPSLGAGLIQQSLKLILGLVKILLGRFLNQSESLHVDCPALEDHDVLVAGPDHVGVHGALLGVLGDPGVGALVDIFDKHVVQAVQALLVMILVEAGEDHLDVLVQEHVHRGAPELPLQPGVDRHHNVGLLHFLGLDKS